MGIRSIILQPLAHFKSTHIEKDCYRAIENQTKILHSLTRKARKTVYGKENGFDKIRDYTDFAKKVPLVDYEKLKPYIQRIIDGEKDILWPGLPIYFAKTSGTTSGSKHIPISKESIHNHIDTARNALLMYAYRTKNYAFADHYMIFVQGSPELDTSGIIPTGRLSGIVAHHVPAYLKKKRMPSWRTNCIEDWESKIDAIVAETLKKPMSLISGIPSWLRMYFEKITQATGKKVGEVFPDFSLLVYGGLNFEPYRNTIKELIGRYVDTIELYPASEGFIAFQDRPGEAGLLLNTNSGIFYEFIAIEKSGNGQPQRIQLKDVQLNREYEIILSTNAGLWAYRIGDTVQFITKDPYRIKVTGRVTHFISAFGEHVIASEVEEALNDTCMTTGGRVNEFTVAPQVNPIEGLPYHEWLIEFDQKPNSPDEFATLLDDSMRKRNSYYNDLIKGQILQPLKITSLSKDTFKNYLKSEGLLGGQNKVVHLADNRVTAEELLRFSR